MKWLCRKECRIACAALLGIVIVVAPIAQAGPPTLKWSSTYSGIGSAEGRSIAVDGAGIYVTGRTWQGVPDIFLLRYDLTGNAVWDRTWGADGKSDQGFNVAVSGAEVHVVGSTRRYTRDNEADTITLKYSTDGVLDRRNSQDGWWTMFTSHGYDGFDYGKGLALDQSGKLYVTGTSEHGYRNTWTYLERYDKDGTKEWHQHYGESGVGNDTGSYRTVMSGENLYVTAGINRSGPGLQAGVLKYRVDGTFVWAYRWGPDRTIALDAAIVGSDVYVTGLTSEDLLLLKLHDDGNSVEFVDSTVFGGQGMDIGRGIMEVEGQIIIAGETVVGGNTDAVLLGYDTDLNLLWELTWGGDQDDVAYDVAVQDGILYVTGMVDNEAFINAYILEDGCPYDMRKLTTKCKRGKLAITAVLKDDSHNGEEFVFDVGGGEFTTTIKGNKAKLSIKSLVGEYEISVPLCPEYRGDEDCE